LLWTATKEDENVNGYLTHEPNLARLEELHRRAAEHRAVRALLVDSRPPRGRRSARTR
jgi:hypothetical protein